MLEYPLREALTFDDVLLLPGESDVLPKQVELRTRLTRQIELRIPLISAAMDTVTVARTAIAMAAEGGIGVIHKNLSIDRQVLEVTKVKKYESGMVENPVTIEEGAQLSQAVALMREHQISGIPVIRQAKLVGIITNRDLRFGAQPDPARLGGHVQGPDHRPRGCDPGAGQGAAPQASHREAA